MQKGKKYLLFVLILVLGVGLDQVTKQIANVTLGVSCNTEYPGYDPALASECPYDHEAFFTWYHIYNEGAFLSMGDGWPEWQRLLFLTVLPTLLLVGVAFWMLRSDKATRFEVITFALIAAGGFGNLIDRMVAGKVVDFMFMNLDIFNAGWDWAKTGIFNVADLYIMAGVAMYIIVAARTWLKSMGKPKTEDVPS